MELIFYCADPNDPSSGLLNEVSAMVHARELVVCRDFDGLKGTLLKPEYDPYAAILAVANRQDLLDLLSIEHLLHSIRVILILPDRDKETISKGHDLRPRFLTWPPWDSSEIIAVLSKMLGNVDKCQSM